MPHPDSNYGIQLNSKRLVFLFAGATVVSVVIFLCGVLVGRGVRVERSADVDSAALSVPAEPTAQAPAPSAAPTAAGSDPTAAAAPPTADDLSYFDRLQTSNPRPEQLKAPEQPAAAPKAAVSAPPPSAPARTGVAANNDPTRAGYTVQIAALNVQSEADAIADRLASKGYAAYVLSPASGTPQIYRVRIGKFASRREAETMAAKLEKEEQFKPWVTR